MKRMYPCCHSCPQSESRAGCGGNPENVTDWIPRSSWGMTILLKLSLVIILLVFFMPMAKAHKLEPAYLEINEQSAGKFSILWKKPLVSGKPMNLSPQLPSDCSNLTEPVPQPSDSGSVERWFADCGINGIVNKKIVINGLSATQTDTLLRIQLADGSTHTTVLRPDSPSFVIPPVASKSEVAGSYLVLGIEHILGGIDHLLFVLGLLLIVRGVGLLVKTVTAFTVAHSITLAMATLGFVKVPQAPVEAVIALSILFLATELMKLHDGKVGLTARYPWLVAMSFGLLHGFGFAGALTAIGLPQTAIPLALFTFNVGVEAGQLIFIAAALGVIWVLKRIPMTWPAWSLKIPPYAIGSLAAFWVIQRTTSFW